MTDQPVKPSPYNQVLIRGIKLHPQKHLEKALDFIRAGGFEQDLAELWQVPESIIHQLVHLDQAAYRDADRARGDIWGVKVFKELTTVAFADVRKCFDEKGELLPPPQWPNEVALAVAKVTCKETTDGDETERSFSVVMGDRMKALELLGKMFAMFVERSEVNVNLNIADELKRARLRVEESNRKRLASQNGKPDAAG